MIPMAGMNDAILTVQERLGYVFNDPELLKLSLTHPSFAQDSGSEEGSNQRLEFLGDAILGMVIAELLYHHYPHEQEGFLTRRRSALVKGAVLVEIAEALELEPFLRMGRAEINAGARGRNSRLEDAVEAVIGAVYLDGGLQPARNLVHRLYGNVEERLKTGMVHHNPKGRLQEWVQSRGGNTDDIVYAIRETTGPDHARNFLIELSLSGKIIGKGQASSRKQAESEAAIVGLKTLEAGSASSS